MTTHLTSIDMNYLHCPKGKRGASVLLSLAWLAVLTASAQDFQYKGQNYSVIDREARTCRTEETILPSGTGYSHEVIIPSVVYDGETEYSVTEIGDHSYLKRFSLEKITLPNTVTRIGNGAFAFCDNLAHIDLPSSLVEIGDSAFYHYEYYHHIGPEPDCLPRRSAKSEIEPSRIPDGVKRIGKCAFMLDNLYDDTHVIPANIPSGLTEIKDSTFYCNAPADLTMPASLKKIGKYAFYKGMNGWNNSYPGIPDLSIPDNVTSIGKMAFAHSIVGSVRLPSSLSEMGSSVFEGCFNLKSVIIPEGVTVIGARAFGGKFNGIGQYCESVPISSIHLPSTVKEIGDSAFHNCSLLTEINLPNSLEKIGSAAFRGCSLESVSLPPLLTEISDYLFLSNKSLTSVTIPPSVTKIGVFAFNGTDLRNGISLPENVRTIEDGAFIGCQFEEISIPNSVTTISWRTFQDCSRLQRVILPDNINTITECMFEGCGSLRYVAKHSMPYAATDGNFRIPIGIDTIRYHAFSNCTSIKSASIPQSVSLIDGNPFTGCDSLTSLFIDDKNDNYKIYNQVIYTIGGDTLVAAPRLLKGDYYIPQGVSTIGREAFYGCSELESLTMHDGVLHIEEGAFGKCTGLSDPIISKSIVSIGRGAFAGVNFTKIVLPPSLKRIDSGFGDPDSYYPQYNLESVWIYGTFDMVETPFCRQEHIANIYYLTDTPQSNHGNYWDYLNNYNYIDWGLSVSEYIDRPLNNCTLYVLEEVYDEITNGDYYPWKKFKNICIYDPTDDPFLSSVDEVGNDIDFSLPVSVFTLSGVRVADSADNLPSGIYIVRQGAKAKKIAVN